MSLARMMLCLPFYFCFICFVCARAIRAKTTTLRRSRTDSLCFRRPIPCINIHSNSFVSNPKVSRGHSSYFPFVRSFLVNKNRINIGHDSVPLSGSKLFWNGDAEMPAKTSINRSKLSFSETNKNVAIKIWILETRPLRPPSGLFVFAHFVCEFNLSSLIIFVAPNVWKHNAFPFGWFWTRVCTGAACSSRSARLAHFVGNGCVWTADTVTYRWWNRSF